MTTADDGCSLESSEGSHRGSPMNTGAATVSLGDDAAMKQYHGSLSFSNGANLPDTAVITSVTLKIMKSEFMCSRNSVSMFQGFKVDIKKGLFGRAGCKRAIFRQPQAILITHSARLCWAGGTVLT